MAETPLTVAVRIDAAKLRQQLRDAIRDALKDFPETLATFEESWARNDNESEAS